MRSLCPSLSRKESMFPLAVQRIRTEKSLHILQSRGSSYVVKSFCSRVNSNVSGCGEKTHCWNANDFTSSVSSEGFFSLTCSAPLVTLCTFQQLPDPDTVVLSLPALGKQVVRRRRLTTCSWVVLGEGEMSRQAPATEGPLKIT